MFKAEPNIRFVHILNVRPYVALLQSVDSSKITYNREPYVLPLNWSIVLKELIFRFHDIF